MNPAWPVVVLLAALAAQNGVPSEAELDAVIDDEVIEMVGEAPPPGSQAEIDTERLERHELDDVHRVLEAVAGVYVRDEDGYGLRPNIGMRGAAAERSAKVTLMEDGVLIAPAPYSAPAAYYFPMVTRMSRIEVVKGPSSIQFGPSTVGGAVNLHGAELPPGTSGYVDAALGSYRHGKLHARASEVGPRWGVGVEYVKLRTTGFKELDGGGDTGFDKNDLQVVARASSAATDRRHHELELKAGWADEVSNETYTGLTDEHFAAAPQRRYAATRLDRMDWDHLRLSARHRLEVGGDVSIETVLYRHDFDRAWGKIAGFVGEPDLAAVLADPDAGANAVYAALLAGEIDSSTPEEEIIFGTNDRSFLSQGLQSHGKAELTVGPTLHLIEAGARLHFDRAARRRDEETYRMAAGDLVRAERPAATVLDSVAETLAVALFARDTARWNRLELTAGLRVEAIRWSFIDRMTDAAADDDYLVPIPGAGLQYLVADQLALLAGVHRGFVPVAPSMSTGGAPESSVNYELGARHQDGARRAEVIGFYSDYANLKGTCTFSTGCAEVDVDREFDGGQVHVYGLEVQATDEIALGRGLRAPLEVAYTLTGSAFQSSFASEFAGWGEVAAGDQLPYLPAHLLAVGAGLGGARWEVSGYARWRSSARDLPGQGPIAEAERIDDLFTLDAAAHLQLGDWAELYLTGSNLLDTQVVVARRPYGARPNPPRLVTLGFKARL